MGEWLGMTNETRIYLTASLTRVIHLHNSSTVHLTRSKPHGYSKPFNFSSGLTNMVIHSHYRPINVTTLHSVTSLLR